VIWVNVKLRRGTVINSRRSFIAAAAEFGATPPYYNYRVAFYALICLAGRVLVKTNGGSSAKRERSRRRCRD
jgi:hypothetical protein